MTRQEMLDYLEDHVIGGFNGSSNPNRNFHINTEMMSDGRIMYWYNRCFYAVCCDWLNNVTEGYDNV